jgi:putative transposase
MTREKKIGGRKRHLLVDTLGLIWGLAVLPANVQDWVGAEEVFRRTTSTLPRLAIVRADSAYRAFAAWVAKHCHWLLDIVTRRSGTVGFAVQPWRWIVERTFGWFGRYRRLSKDYETNPRSSEAWVYIAMTHRMSRLLLPERNRDEFLLRRPRRQQCQC